jgi:hypothetical protein
MLIPGGDFKVCHAFDLLGTLGAIRIAVICDDGSPSDAIGRV